MQDDKENRSHHEEGMEGEAPSPGGFIPPNVIAIPVGASIAASAPQQSSVQVISQPLPSPQNEKIAKRFGERLRKIRKLRGLSIYELADKSEVDAGYISRLENAHRNPPSPRILQRFADTLNVSQDLLMIAAGYIELDSQRKPFDETAITYLIEQECKSVKKKASTKPLSNGAVELGLASLITSGDFVLAVNPEEECIRGPIFLYMAIGNNLLLMNKVIQKLEKLPTKP